MREPFARGEMHRVQRFGREALHRMAEDGCDVTAHTRPLPQTRAGHKRNACERCGQGTG